MFIWCYVLLLRVVGALKWLHTAVLGGMLILVTLALVIHAGWLTIRETIALKNATRGDALLTDGKTYKQGDFIVYGLGGTVAMSPNEFSLRYAPSVATVNSRSEHFQRSLSLNPQLCAARFSVYQPAHEILAQKLTPDAIAMYFPARRCGT